MLLRNSESKESSQFSLDREYQLCNACGGQLSDGRNQKQQIYSFQKDQIMMYDVCPQCKITTTSAKNSAILNVSKEGIEEQNLKQQENFKIFDAQEEKEENDDDNFQFQQVPEEEDDESQKQQPNYYNGERYERGIQQEDIKLKQHFYYEEEEDIQMSNNSSKINDEITSLNQKNSIKKEQIQDQIRRNSLTHNNSNSRSNNNKSNINYNQNKDMLIKMNNARPQSSNNILRNITHYNYQNSQINTRQIFNEQIMPSDQFPVAAKNNLNLLRNNSENRQLLVQQYQYQISQRQKENTSNRKPRNNSNNHNNNNNIKRESILPNCHESYAQLIVRRCLKHLNKKQSEKEIKKCSTPPQERRMSELVKNLQNVTYFSLLEEKYNKKSKIQKKKV